MTDLLQIANDGAEIVETNYWESEYAGRGLFFLSTNAGCLRLLVPSSRFQMVRDMTDGVREVVLTRGAMGDAEDVVEIMFDDGSDQPMCIHIDPTQADRLWVPGDESRRWSFAIWTAGGKAASFDRCFLRRGVLPCLEPWKG